MKRLIISGFLVILLGITAYTTGFVLMVNNVEAPQPKLHNHTIVTEATTKEAGYIIRVESGVLVIYGENGELYDRTSISLSLLPRDIQIKVLNGYFIGTARELYRLLETYST